MFTFFLLLVGIAVSSASPVLSEGSAVSSRVVSGRDGDIAEVPWLASMEVDGRQNCGGSIISEYWIVSAAHCFHRDIGRYSARVGSSYASSGGAVHAIEFYINHPLYNTAAAHSHDINLVKVVEPIVFSALVQPISLPAQSAKVATAALSTVAGWGYMTGDSGGPLSVDKLLVGVVSWGMGCIVPGWPSVYADVAYLRDWITENSGV